MDELDAFKDPQFEIKTGHEDNAENDELHNLNQDDQTLPARPGEEMHFSMDFLLGPQQVQWHPLEPSFPAPTLIIPGMSITTTSTATACLQIFQTMH